MNVFPSVYQKRDLEYDLGYGVWVSAPVGSTQGGTEPLLSLSCVRQGSLCLAEVVAGVSLCWKSHTLIPS